MARTTTKKRNNAATQSSQPQVTATPTSSSIPEPFVLLPEQLRPLTSTLPTDHVYAVHIDYNPITLKRRVYVVPILLNLVITCILAIRVYYAAPQYLDQIITIFGYETAWKVEPENMAYTSLLSTIANRTGLLMTDYAIFAFVGSWPWEFLFGSKYSRHTGPIGWRRQVGFKGTEIVVRKGRKWDDKLVSEDGNKKWTREDELSILVRVGPALSKSYTSKTGYLLLDKDWDLDFRAMIDAHRLVDSGKLDLKDLDHIVLVCYQNKWLLWRVHGAIEASILNTENDATISKFREKLSSLGQEDIFFRWIEIVQYESSLPGGFTHERKTEAVRELRRLLTERKVDYGKFWGEIGGSNGVPGLIQTS